MFKIKWSSSFVINLMMANSKCCKYHPEASVIEDHRAGDEICTECGLVVGDRTIDVSVNWRTFGHENVSKKESGLTVGHCNPLLNGSDLGTFIEPFSSLPPRRQRSTEHCSRPSKCCVYENNKYYKDLKVAFTNITRIGEHLLLSSTTIFKAQQIFKGVTEKDMSKSFYKEEVFAACIYIACRQDKVPRTFKEICAASNSSASFAIGAHFKNIVKLLELKTEQIYPEDFVPRFCAKLTLPYEVEKIASRIVIDVNYVDLFEGHSHVTGVGAAILIASSRTEYKRSLRQVAQICGVSEMAITKARDTLYPFALKTLTKWFPIYAPPVPMPLKINPQFSIDTPIRKLDPVTVLPKLQEERKSIMDMERKRPRPIIKLISTPLVKIPHLQ